MNEHTKSGLDITSIGTVIAALMDFVPHITAVLSLIWVMIRIYETKTVQRWLRRNHDERRVG